MGDETGPIAVPIRLVCVAGEDMGKMVRVGTDPIVLGRGQSADVRLTGNDVSRRHALLSIKEGEFLLRDLDSANGTFVNGTPVSDTVSLKIGDRIQMGNTILVFSHYDELEARMQRLQRIEAMAAMVGGVAHDFRNALTVILAGLDVFDELLPLDASTLRETAKNMTTATTAASALAKRLLNIGRRDATAYDLVNLSEVVDETAAMTKHLLGRSISVAVSIDTSIAVRGSREELHQVFVNLLVNAKDAMPDGGAITISAAVVKLERAPSLAYHLPSQGSYAELRIEDTGIGMDEGTLARAFEPFFTTKPPGLGTGLGLAVIHGIVKRHGGSILVDSAPARGTTFRIYLPVA